MITQNERKGVASQSNPKMIDEVHVKICKKEKDNIARSVKKVKRGLEGWAEERSGERT